MALTQSTIILGFTGPLGSGCSYIAEALSEKCKYKYYKLSDVIKDGVSPSLRSDVQALQDEGNRLRESKGTAYLVYETFERIQGDQEEYIGCIIDGIKNVGEIEALRGAPNFFLFSIQANNATRKERLVGNRFETEDAFEKADTRDELEDSINGQQVKKCDYLSDIIILNDESIPQSNFQRKDKFIDGIKWRYIDPIEKYSRSGKAGLINPTIDELCMTTAFSMSKMSSCLKRKVGAIIIQENKRAGQPGDDIKEFHLTMPNIVSSGYNDVPLGQAKCIYYPKIQMCYRDYLQARHAKKLEFCPNCSKKITGTLNTDYKCSGCGIEIFKEFVPGAKHSPGKLLDMCRALHAEEVCLLNLVNYNVVVDNLILYTTTQPCNLCANKIVNSGIRKVIFSEPYTMKESEEILAKGGVEVRRFQGIKSNAFFKLYQD